MAKKIKFEKIKIKTITFVMQIYFESKKLNNDGKFLWVVFGELENNIEGYEIFFDLDLIHKNYTGKFIDNKYARKNIAEGEYPIVEDAFQWIEKNIGYVVGNDTIEDLEVFLDMIFSKVIEESHEKLSN